MTELSETDQAISKLLDLTQELIGLGKFDEADRFLSEIEKHKPDDLNVPFQRGTLLLQKHEYKQAIQQFLIVDRKKPDFFPNLNNLGSCYYHINKYDIAISYFKRALEKVPNSDLFLMMIAYSLTRKGHLDEAISYYRRALESNPNLYKTHSSLLMTMMYSENVSAEELLEESRNYGKKVAHLFDESYFHDNEKLKNRRLKIGYVSQDFRDHPIPYFLEPLLQSHSREDFEVYAYSSTEFDNPFMDRMKGSVDLWQDVRKFNDEEISDAIRKDKIDILIDISGHTGNNNLKVFARKPAPIQITWLGYPATTGLNTIDYKISDPYVEPIGESEHFNTETIWRLPHIFCCYKPHENSPDVIDRPPFEDNGYITFGCFNNFIKVRDPVMRAWGKILKNVPKSRFILEINAVEDPDFMADVQRRLIDQECPLDQFIIEPRKRSNQFSLYNKIDIALDPFPCTGGTTSMDTLWMGVPLITLAGREFATRMSTSILTNVGLQELVADNIDDYIKIAINLASDRNRLREIRYNLRDRFAASPAMDQKSFTQDMENIYRSMWHKYCES